MEHIISFPGLGFEFNINRVAFNVLGKDIFWYGIIIAFGFVLAAFYVCNRSKQFGLTSDSIVDLLIFALPIAIICARAYYVIFSWESYKDNILEIFAIWHGGLAIYGGIIGSIVTAYVFCSIKKINFGDLVDLGSLGILIGQIIGRWGNFVNAEAYGGPTNLPWRMNIGQTIAQAGELGAHPTFFYESLWNFIGFILLHFYSKKRRFKGEVFLMYVAWYGAGRFFIEGLRTDSLYFMGTAIRTSQILALVSMVFAIIAIVYKRRKIKNEVSTEVDQ